MDFFLHILDGLQVMGYWGYLVAFLFAFLESLAMVGGFIPGSTAIVFLGLMCSQGYLNIYFLLVVTIIGAILGDNVSYWLGTKGKGYFKEENKILKLQHLKAGEKFFAKHGNKSILLGRFVGVIRPMIPFAAGLSKMKYQIFLFWTIIGGMLWATAHVLLGFFFGNALGLIKIWTHRIGFVALILIIAIAIAWYLLKKAKPTAEALVKFFSLEEKYNNSSFLRFVLDYFPNIILATIQYLKNNFYGWPLASLGFIISVILLLLSLLADNFLDSNHLNRFDDMVSGFFYFARDPFLVNIFVWLSLLCSTPVVICLSFLFIIKLYFVNRKYFILPFILSVGGSSLIGWIMKILIDRPRPFFFTPVYFEPSWSFPSSHAILAITLYGFILYYFLRYQSDIKIFTYKFWVILVGIIFIFSIGFSRLYLGVHYFSDVVGGYIIGLLVLALVIALNEWFLYRKVDEKINSLFPYFVNVSKENKLKLSFVIIIIFVTFFVVYGLYFYHPIYLIDNGVEMSKLNLN